MARWGDPAFQPVHQRNRPPVLDGADEAKAQVRVVLEVQHRIDHVFKHTRAGQLAVFGLCGNDGIFFCFATRSEQLNSA